MRHDKHRRRLLQAALAGGSAALLPRLGNARGGGTAACKPRPHYMVFVNLAGGYDAVLTVDPKDAQQPGIDIDPGYRAAQMIRGKRRMYGPLLGALSRHESDLCLIHGVRVDTVSHDEGNMCLARGRSVVSPSTSSIGDTLGACLPGTAPIEFLLLQDQQGFPDRIGTRGYLPRAVALPPSVTRDLLNPAGFPYKRQPWYEKVQRARNAELRALFAQDPKQAALWIDRNNRAAALDELLVSADHTTRFVDPQLGHKFQLAFHAIRDNHARFITVAAEDLHFDSHTDNMRIQEQRLSTAFQDIAAFVDLLKSTHNEFGSLFDQVTIAIASELGRYPKINHSNGKDHWPENSWMLLGRGIKRAEGGVTVGATDARYRGVAVDYVTGNTESGNRRPLFIDAVFATLIDIAGRDPRAHGYSADDVVRCITA
jgi:hypothetical protein